MLLSKVGELENDNNNGNELDPRAVLLRHSRYKIKAYNVIEKNKNNAGLTEKLAHLYYNAIMEKTDKRLIFLLGYPKVKSFFVMFNLILSMVL